jgi:hypothetical protein
LPSPGFFSSLYRFPASSGPFLTAIRNDHLIKDMRLSAVFNSFQLRLEIKSFLRGAKGKPVLRVERKANKQDAIPSNLGN